MQAEVFARVIDVQIRVCKDVLTDKAREYATDADRLHNFRIAATLQGETAQQALAGMMAKHTVSIYDMCHSDQEFPMELWIEKITDHINFLLLLKALVYEDLVIHPVKEDPEFVDQAAMFPVAPRFHEKTGTIDKETFDLTFGIDQSTGQIIDKD